MSLLLSFTPIRRALRVLLTASVVTGLLWILFFAPLGIWWKIILVITMLGIGSIGMYLHVMWVRARTNNQDDVTIPMSLPPKPAREPAVGQNREDVFMNMQSSPPHASELKYCERLKPVVVICLATLATILSFASLMLGLQVELGGTIGVGLLWLNVALWLYIAGRVYLWSKTYLIVTVTRAILATITPIFVVKPNVLLKDASSQDVRRNLLDQWFKTGTLFLDTPSKEDTMWHHLRWVRHPERLERALGLPTTKEINDAIHKDQNLRKVIKNEKHRK